MSCQPSNLDGAPQSNEITRCPREVILKAEVGFKRQTGPTPNFIREIFREDALVAREILREILLGGVALTEEAAKMASDMDLASLGASLNAPLQLATLDQRIAAAKAIIQTGVGFKTDHTTDDEPLRRQVVLMPPWADEVEQVEPASIKGALPSGNPSGNGGKRNGDKKATKARKKK